MFQGQLPRRPRGFGRPTPREGLGVGPAGVGQGLPSFRGPEQVRQGFGERQRIIGIESGLTTLLISLTAAVSVYVIIAVKDYRDKRRKGDLKD